MRAFITGITGQDGSYLTELLLKKGYKVYGIDRRVAIEDTKNRYSRIGHLLDKITLYSGTIQDYSRMFEIINEVKPDEFYHLAAQSFVGTSFKDEFSVIDINTKGTVNVLNILKKVKPNCKFYFAGSSEMFGQVLETPQNELTPFNPCSPYGISKCSGYYFTKLYRDSYNMFCCSGILFNHESERRGLEFVTRKISNSVAEIKSGFSTELRLGNLSAKRDWGHSKDYVYAMWMMLQKENPEDYVIATGETHTIEEFVEEAFDIVELNWKDYVVIDEKFYRPTDVNMLVGDYSKAKIKLNWEPKIRFKELIRLMVEHDLNRLKNNK